MFKLVKDSMEWNNLDVVVGDERKLKWLAYDSMDKDVLPRQAGPSALPCSDLTAGRELLLDPSSDAALEDCFGSDFLR